MKATKGPNHLSSNWEKDVKLIKKKRFKRVFFQKFSACLFFACLLSILTLYHYGFVNLFLSFTKQYLLVTAQQMGLLVKNIEVTGQYYTCADFISKTVNAFYLKPIFECDIHLLKIQLEKNGWIQSVIVQRYLPYALKIHLNERKPIALWHHQKNLYVVDKEGLALLIDSGNDKIKRFFSNLPILQGQDAPQNLSRLLEVLTKYKKIYEMTKTLIYVRSRRWNMVIDKKTIVLLPEENLDQALKKLSKILDKIPTYKCEAIDLRIPGKTLLKTETNNLQQDDQTYSANKIHSI